MENVRRIEQTTYLQKTTMPELFERNVKIPSEWHLGPACIRYECVFGQNEAVGKTGHFVLVELEAIFCSPMPQCCS